MTQLIEWADRGIKAAIINIVCMFWDTEYRKHLEYRDRRYKEDPNGAYNDEKCNIWNGNIL